MKSKVVILSLVMLTSISSQSFAQGIISGVFKQNNSAPVEDRVITQKPKMPGDYTDEKLVKDSGKPKVYNSIPNNENIPNNCIGRGSSWNDCVPVETSAVVPQSNLEGKSLEPIKLKDVPVSNLQPKAQEVMVQEDKYLDKNEEIIPLAAYPENIHKYKDKNGNVGFTNKVEDIPKGSYVEKMNLSNLPDKSKDGEMVPEKSVKVKPNQSTIKKESDVKESKKSSKPVVKSTLTSKEKNIKEKNVDKKDVKAKGKNEKVITGKKTETAAKKEKSHKKT